MTVAELSAGDRATLRGMRPVRSDICRPGKIMYVNAEGRITIGSFATIATPPRNVQQVRLSKADYDELMR